MDWYATVPDLAGGVMCAAWLRRAESPVMRVQARVIDNKHSSDVQSPPPPLRVCISIHAEGESSSDLGRVLVLCNPPATCLKVQSGKLCFDLGRVLVLNDPPIRAASTRGWR